MCLGFSLAACLGFLGGKRIPPILKDAACSSTAGQGFRHCWARSHQSASCPRHLLVVTLMQDPSCPMCHVKPAKSFGFSATISPAAPASGSVSDGGLGCIAARGSSTPVEGPCFASNMLVKEGLPWELVVGLAECPLVMLIATCRCGANAGGAHWDN